MEDNSLHNIFGGAIVCSLMNEVGRLPTMLQVIIYALGFSFLWLAVIIGSAVFALYVSGMCIVGSC